VRNYFFMRTMREDFEERASFDAEPFVIG